MRWTHFLKARGWIWTVARSVGREIGPREIAILAVSLGIYLVTRALWPEGAAGVALVVGGGLALWVTGRIERNLLKGIEAKGESR